MHWRVPLSCAVSRWRKQKSSASLRLNQRCIRQYWTSRMTPSWPLMKTAGFRSSILRQSGSWAAGPRIPWTAVEAVLPNTLLPDVLESGEKQLDQIMQIHQTLCNTNRIPILVDGQRRGVVATFQDVKQLQNSEQKIRLKLHEKGLVAKYASTISWGTPQPSAAPSRLPGAMPPPVPPC